MRILALLFALLWAMAAEAAPRYSLSASCAASGGQWSAIHRECARISARWCARHKGRFNACASACRHNPDPRVMCIMVCVPVCNFK